MGPCPTPAHGPADTHPHHPLQKTMECIQGALNWMPSSGALTLLSCPQPPRKGQGGAGVATKQWPGSGGRDGRRIAFAPRAIWQTTGHGPHGLTDKRVPNQRTHTTRVSRHLKRRLTGPAAPPKAARMHAGPSTIQPCANHRWHNATCRRVRGRWDAPSVIDHGAGPQLRFRRPRVPFRRQCTALNDQPGSLW